MERQQRKKRNRNSQRKGNAAPQPAKKPQMKFSIDSSVYVPKVQEPHVICSICGKGIDAIASAISEPDGSYSHFDCVIQKIKEQYHVEEGQKVSYLGRGVFGIIEMKDGAFTILDRINYESPESLHQMKNFVESNKK